MQFFILVSLLLTQIFWSAPAHALLMDLRNRYSPLILSETAPFVFSPAPLTPKDYQVQWVGKALADLTFKIGQKSIEWVRGDLVFVLPRGRLIVDAKGVEAGSLRNQDFSQSMVVKDNVGHGELPIVMLAGDRNQIQISIKRNGKIETGTLELIYQPTEGNAALVMIDPSCSPFNVRKVEGNIPRNSWLYLSCRLVYSQGDRHQTSSLELYAHFNNVGQSLEIDGMPTPSSADSLWALRLRSEPGEVSFASQGQKIRIAYSVRERLRFGSLALGIGPYSYDVTSATTNVNTYTAIATLYASYFIQEDLQIVAFDATSFHKNWYTDFGIYARIENTRAIDERFSLNLLLGFHTLIFKMDGSVYARVSGPQGVELVFRDFLKRRHNLSFGSFFYPVIEDRAYYNIWARYGTGNPFYEFNYIDWQEPVNGVRARNKSLGITIGFPVGGFL